MRRTAMSLIVALALAGNTNAQSVLESDPGLLTSPDVAHLPTDGCGYSMLPYLQEEALLMHRSSGGFGGDMDWAAGPRLVFGLPIGQATAIEFGYFGLFNMNGSTFDPAPVPANLGGGVTGTAVNSRADYRSTVNNGELGLRYWIMPQVSLLAGFRYMNWHENLNTAFDPVSPFGGLALPPGSANAVFHTSNNLYGFQLGSNWTPMITDCLGLDIGGKAGIFGAHTEMDASAAFPGLAGASAAASSTRTSFIGEFGIVGTYNVTRFLKLRAGYQVMWIEGLALAPEQIGNVNFGGSTAVSNRGGVFLHGAVVGLEYRW